MGKGGQSISDVEGRSYSGMESVLRNYQDGESYNPTTDRLLRSKEDQEAYKAKRVDKGLFAKGIDGNKKEQMRIEKEQNLQRLNENAGPPANSNPFVLEFWKQFEELPAWQNYYLQRQLQDDKIISATAFDEYKVLVKSKMWNWSLDMGQQGEYESVKIKVKRILSSVITLQIDTNKEVPKFRFKKDENGIETKEVEKYMLPVPETTFERIQIAQWKGQVSSVINQYIATDSNIWTL